MFQDSNASWQLVSDKSPFVFRCGDILAPSIPKTKGTLVFVVDGTDREGKLHLLSKPFNYEHDITDLVTTMILSPEDLIDRGWYFRNDVASSN